MFVPIEVIWKGLWVNYQPKKDGNLPKSLVLKEILEYGKQSIKDGFTQRIACIFISKALPLLFSVEHELENQFYQLEKLSTEQQEGRLNTIPEIPSSLREQLKREVREEILGRKSAQDLVDLGRKAREGNNNKRTFTSPDLQDVINKRQKTANSENSDKSLTPSLSIPTISVVSLQTPGISSFKTISAKIEESGDVNNNSNIHQSPLRPIQPTRSLSSIQPLQTSQPTQTTQPLSPQTRALQPTPSLQLPQPLSPQPSSPQPLLRTLSTPPITYSADSVQINSPKLTSLSPPVDGRVLREVQALRSSIAVIQKDIDELKESIDKRDIKEKSLNGDIIKMKAEISILSAMLNSASGTQKSNLGSLLPSSSTFKIKEYGGDTDSEGESSDEKNTIINSNTGNGNDQGTKNNNLNSSIVEESVQVVQ